MKETRRTKPAEGITRTTANPAGCAHQQTRSGDAPGANARGSAPGAHPVSALQAGLGTVSTDTAS